MKNEFFNVKPWHQTGSNGYTDVDGAGTPDLHDRPLPAGAWPAGAAEGNPTTARALFSGGVGGAHQASGAPAPGLGGFTRATRARLHAAGADATLPPVERCRIKPS
jgi:hypothetical protein